MAKILAVCLSEKTGTAKNAVKSAALTPGHGIEGDAHAGEWHRQVSLLATESVEVMRGKGVALPPGVFGENILTEGINLVVIPVGTTLRIGEGAALRVTQIGKECHDRCAIYYAVGDCIMPREGIFCEVIAGGTVAPGDAIRVV